MSTAITDSHNFSFILDNVGIAQHRPDFGKASCTPPLPARGSRLVQEHQAWEGWAPFSESCASGLPFEAGWSVLLGGVWWRPG